MSSSGMLVLFVCAIAALASEDQQQRRRDRPGWPCIAGRAFDPSFYDLAEGTGGQLFLFDPSEIARSHVLMIGRQQHAETIFRASGNLAASPRVFEFPVDSTIESLLLSVSLQCRQSVAVENPAGQEVAGASAASEDHEFQAGRILKIISPAPGMWKVRVAGRGMFFVVAEAKSEIALDEVRFVERGGRPGHEGMFPTGRPPKLSVAQMLEASLSGPARDVSFHLLSSAGEPLGTLDLERVSEDGDFLGVVTPGNSKFRVAAQGRDENGWPFQRLHPPLFQAAP